MLFWGIFYASFNIVGHADPNPPPPVPLRHDVIYGRPLKPIFHCDAKYLASGSVLGNAHDARILRWRYQHVGILEPTQTFKFASPPTPNLKIALPRPQPPTPVSGILVALGPQRKIFALGMNISCCLCQFHLGRAPNANSFFSGIWAY